MKENEKKAEELREEELENVSGGFRRPEYGGAPSASRTVNCPDCGTTFLVHVKALENATCPNCGCRI